MSRLRVAHISYLNSAPFFVGMNDERMEMVDLHPRALGQAAERGEIDAGLMSIVDTFRMPHFEPLGDLAHFFVAWQLDSIFDHRQKIVNQLIVENAER